MVCLGDLFVYLYACLLLPINTRNAGSTRVLSFSVRPNLRTTGKIQYWKDLSMITFSIISKSSLFIVGGSLWTGLQTAEISLSNDHQNAKKKHLKTLKIPTLSKSVTLWYLIAQHFAAAITTRIKCQLLIFICSWIVGRLKQFWKIRDFRTIF